MRSEELLPPLLLIFYPNNYYFPFMDNIVAEKSKLFAIRIVKLYKYLLKEKHESILSKQLVRSGTSIGANIAEAEYGISKNDFIAKMYIALKECAETQYWLDLLCASHYLSQPEYDSISSDCAELKRLLSSITKTSKDSID